MCNDIDHEAAEIIGDGGSSTMFDFLPAAAAIVAGLVLAGNGIALLILHLS